MMERLPEDLWVQIFLRLPVKTILRCLSVCKPWQLFIQHPSFINSHLQHQRRNLMLVRSIIEDKEKKSCIFSLDDDEPTLAEKAKSECYSLYCDDEQFSAYAKHEFPIYFPPWGHHRVVGICNGIICITSDQFSICHQTYIWNPTIRKCLELPRPIFTFDTIGGFDHELGFGFDEKTNDYKVIRIVERDDWDEVPLEVEIYSLNSGIWRKASHLATNLGVRIFERYGTGRNYQVYLNGSVYWIGEDRVQSRCMVIALHLGDEVFRCFEPPLGTEHDFFQTRELRPIAFQGSLSLIHYRKPKCSIWMMKDYGQSTSWVKHVDVNLSNHVDRVIGLRKKGELLIGILGGLYTYKPTKGKELVYLDGINLLPRNLLQEDHMEGMNVVSQRVYDYDPESTAKGLGIRSKTKGNFQFSFYSESYTESLVLLGRMNFTEVAKSKSKDYERNHEEDNNVADLVDELQNLGEEGTQC